MGYILYTNVVASQKCHYASAPMEATIAIKPLFRSQALFSRRSKSIGESFLPSPISWPYLFYSAIDTTSMFIDFSKGNVEEGVVNSLLSWGLASTLNFSVSPLKWTTSMQSQLRFKLPIL